VFGASSHPSYHGHSYTCDVTVSGPVDDTTGFVVDLGRLDRVLDEQVRQRFDFRNLNVDVPEFASGELIPTGENLAHIIFANVQAALGTDVRVTTVTVAEDVTLSATVTEADL
jgi:6-pyruvoyltetrahydropterin/6-carboxytetrahydropterin synthase